MDVIEVTCVVCQLPMSRLKIIAPASMKFMVVTFNVLQLLIGPLKLSVKEQIQVFTCPAASAKLPKNRFAGKVVVSSCLSFT